MGEGGREDCREEAADLRMGSKKEVEAGALGTGRERRAVERSEER